MGEYELSVVVDGCTDNSEEVVKNNVQDIKNYTVLFAPNVFETKANNIGLREAVGDKVIIVQDVGEARGKEARYDPDKETIILLGNPVLEDKERGITKGDKLTFFLADGRIFVENKGKERSVTVIKRER